ncbi:putative RAN guanine nucleotide release factor [Cryptosporidium canis]|uniref:RAN guanine nucleotide release factor n=1 Tax=Cryptosporidium canis TaxID=195482 RepID=A0A9D5HWE0_9CRYT|nr:putative RAN guanine nucleotide release factor [Cryptosporidium canis]
MKYENKKLYGGAITLNIPEGFDNISDVRDVPDHQEVFVDSFSECSIIVEILEITDVGGYEGNIAEYYFNDISEFNCSLNTKITCSEPLFSYSSDFEISKCVGTQVLDKRYQEGMQREELYLHLAVIRLKSTNADIVISFNCPSRFETRSQSSIMGNDIYSREISRSQVDQIMSEVLKSFAIIDYSLFV